MRMLRGSAKHKQRPNKADGPNSCPFGTSGTGDAFLAAEAHFDSLPRLAGLPAFPVPEASSDWSSGTFGNKTSFLCKTIRTYQSHSILSQFYSFSGDFRVPLAWLFDCLMVTSIWISVFLVFQLTSAYVASPLGGGSMRWFALGWFSSHLRSFLFSDLWSHNLLILPSSA